MINLLTAHLEVLVHICILWSRLTVNIYSLVVGIDGKELDQTLLYVLAKVMLAYVMCLVLKRILGRCDILRVPESSSKHL